MKQGDCPYCGRTGLFIYPVRYAIACPAGANGVPGLSGNFKIENGPADIGDVKYALRALRPGYLYTYDAKRGLLKGYLVMPRGALWSFPIDQPAPTEPPRHMSCTDKIDVTMSYCVDVLHSEKNPAGDLWLGWSSSSWTPALVKMASQAAWRSKHMQRINIIAMLDGYAPHTGEFTEASKGVAHFASDVRTMQKAFGFSNTAITHETRHGREVEKLATGFRQRSYKQQGYIVAVDDPVGITNDLSELTVPSDSNGFDEKLYRGKIVDDLLNQTESAIKVNAKLKFAQEHPALPYKKSIVYKSNFRSFGERVREVAGGDSGAEKEYERQQKRFEEVRQKKQHVAAEDAWKELTTIDGVALLDDDRRKALPKKYLDSLKAFEPKALKLADAHVNWLSSLQLANWLEGVHDSHDLASGFAFRESVAQCVGKAVGTKACQTQLSRWLNSPNTADRRNLYLRGLMFNHDKIAEAAQASVGGGDIKLENVFSIYQGALIRLKRGDSAKLLDRLVLTTANILVKALTQSGKSVGKNATIVSLSLLGRTVVSASNLSPSDIRDWMVDQAKARGLQFTTDSAQTKTDALKAAKNVIPYANHDPGICAYELDVDQLEREGRMALGSVKAVRIPGHDLTKRWLSSSDFNIASVAIILQTVALHFAISDYKSADRFDASQAGYTATLASVSLTAAIVETTASVLESTPTHPLSAFLTRHWAFSTSGIKTTILVAKRVALVAGVFAAMFDFYSAYSAWEKGEHKLAVLYGVSGVTGTVLACTAYFIGAAFFWPAFAAAVAIAIVLSLYKQAMLKKWISHCFYSRSLADERSESGFYSTLDDELIAYDNALGGV
jgi:hypothetical protein